MAEGSAAGLLEAGDSGEKLELSKAQLKKLGTLTEFERKVLYECAKIPEGETRAYSEIANAIGKPGAARAVGNALAKNPLAPLIPCHRVIGTRGMGGYSGKGGVRAKRRMLALERRKTHSLKRS